MPKAKPVSLHPLTFEQAIEAFMKAPPKSKKHLKSKKKKRQTANR